MLESKLFPSAVWPEEIQREQTDFREGASLAIETLGSIRASAFLIAIPALLFLFLAFRPIGASAPNSHPQLEFRISLSSTCRLEI